MPAIGRERRMWVAALIISKRVGIVPAKHLERLSAVLQTHFGNAARPCLAIRDHSLPIGMQVVMSVSPT